MHVILGRENLKEEAVKIAHYINWYLVMVKVAYRGYVMLAKIKFCTKMVLASNALTGPHPLTTIKLVKTVTVLLSFPTSISFQTIRKTCSLFNLTLSTQVGLNWPI